MYDEVCHKKLVTHEAKVLMLLGDDLKNKHELEETLGYHNNNVIFIHFVLQNVFMSGEKGLT